jgi:hypothetical protein
MPIQTLKQPSDKLIVKFELEHEDVFHLKNLYKRIYEWMVDEGFVAAENPYAIDGAGDTYYETLYWERTKPNDTQEHHIWWRGIDLPRGNHYYRYFLKVDYQTLNCKKIEIMHKGQKFGTHKCDVILRIEAWLQLDYRQDWNKNPVTRFFERWFKERFYLADWKKYKDDLYLEAYRLNSAIKQYLEFKAVVDWGRPWHAERGTYHNHENILPPAGGL